MGYRLVKMATELFNELLTEGRRFPSRDGDTLVVVKGLPEGAKLEAVSGDARFEYDQIVLKYSHPSWPDSKRGEAIPFLPVEYKLEHKRPFRGRFDHLTGVVEFEGAVELEPGWKAVSP